MHRALVAAFACAAAALPVHLAAHAPSALELAADAAAIAASYVFTDFAVGVYHHAVDNYGSSRTPVFGYQIAAFQGHHTVPWTITARNLSNNLYRLTIPTLPQLALLEASGTSGPLSAFYGAFLVFIVLSQEGHRQAHMTRPAPWVRSLQDVGLIISPKMHASHHRGAFHGNYCILSGVCNDLLDQSGFFRYIEAIIFTITGVEPICWRLDSHLKEEALNKLPQWMR